MTQPVPRVLIVSSHVVWGGVGAVIAAPCLQALGCEALVMPTCVLSNHPGLGMLTGRVTDMEELGALLDGLDNNGMLAGVDAILTGYLAHGEQATAVRQVVERVKRHNPRALYLCDPVIGDEGKGVYVRKGVPEMIRDRLIPLADITTPNAFELAWLTGRKVTGPIEAEVAARELDCAVAPTSVLLAHDRLGTGLITPGTAHWAVSDRRSGVPHGTGDAFAAILLGLMLRGMAGEDILNHAVAGIDALIRTSEGSPVLATAGLAEVLGELLD